MPLGTILETFYKPNCDQKKKRHCLKKKYVNYFFLTVEYA